LPVLLHTATSYTLHRIWAGAEKLFQSGDYYYLSGWYGVTGNYKSKLLQSSLPG